MTEASTTPVTPIRAGWAQGDITPEIGTGLAGFGVRASRTTRDPLAVRAVALAGADGAPALILSADILWWPRGLVDELRDWAQGLGVPAGHVMLAATHTHSGPEINDETYYHVEPDAQARRQVAAAARDVMARSLDDLAPARAEIGWTHHDATMNRRRKVASPQAWRRGRWSDMRRRPNPQGARDATLGAVWLYREGSDRPGAVLVNYAAHPLFLRGDAISADFPGVVAARLAELNGGPLLCGFLQGFTGDVVPDTSYRSRPRVTGLSTLVERLFDNHRFRKDGGEAAMERFGTGIADAVHAMDRCPLSFAAVTGGEMAIELPLQHPEAVAEGVARHAAAGPWGERLVARFRAAPGALQTPHLHAQLLRLGDEVGFLALSGEIFAAYASVVREILGPSVFTVSCANGMAGYVPTSAATAEGGYEVERATWFTGLMSPVGAAVEARVRAAVESLAGGR